MFDLLTRLTCTIGIEFWTAVGATQEMGSVGGRTPTITSTHSFNAQQRLFG